MYNNKVTMIYVLWVNTHFFENINQNIFENNWHTSETWLMKLYLYINNRVGTYCTIIFIYNA